MTRDSEYTAHAEALYYHMAGDALEAATPETDRFTRAQLIATSMVFSALTLEAFVNRELGQKFDYDRLDEKWEHAPAALGASARFDRGAEPFQTFQDLVRTRNKRLVHFKPWEERRRHGEENAQDLFGDLVQDLDLARRYFAAVEGMIRELHRLTDGRSDIPGFLAGDRYTGKLWVSIGIPYEHLGPSGES